MNKHKEQHESEYEFFDFPLEEEGDDKLSHKRRIRKMIEDRLEKKRLQEEIDELDMDFNWDEIDR